MRNINFICLLFLLLGFPKGQAQSSSIFKDSFTESTTDQEKFQVYLDSIDKYLYRDVHITPQALAKCQEIIDRGTPLSDSKLLEHNLQKIYFALNNLEPLKAYQIVVDSEDFLNNPKLPVKLVKTFNYIKGYTSLALGDLEAAQKAYYRNIENAILNKDTFNIINNLYSLGQLYSEEEDHEAAIKCFLQIVEYHKTITTSPTTVALTDFELAEAFIATEAYDKARKVIKRAFHYITQENLEVLRADFLNLQGELYLAQEQIDSAQYIYQQLSALGIKAKDHQVIFRNQTFLSELYKAQKKYRKALAIHQTIIAQSDSSEVTTRMDSYARAHQICRKLGDKEAAYDYLLAYYQTKSQVEEDQKKQKTAYLKIKYDSEQQAKNNAILTAEITQNTLLYALSILFGLGLLFLFGAFYQKKKYNKRLKAEISKRTANLRKTITQLSQNNQELDEFNRILSHDLKAPLRTIVSYNKLAYKEINNPKKLKEYLGFVEKSGLQLHQLIHDVHTFRNIKYMESGSEDFVDTQLLFHNIALFMVKKYPKKHIRFEHNHLPLISIDSKMLTLIFQNLIDNGIKYNTREQVLIHVKYRYQSKEKIHYFEIKDNGIGIASEFQSKIFEIFKRLNNRSSYTGSGLGLSIAQKTIKKLNGKITLLHSEENLGSTFSIQIPEVNSKHSASKKESILLQN